MNILELFSIYNIDAYITPMNDEHLNEFINQRDNRVRFLTGFTGTAGTAITSEKFNGLITDARYYGQAPKQLTNYELVKEKEIEAYIKHGFKRIGIDPHFISNSKYLSLKEKLAKEGIELVNTEDLVGQVWSEREERKFNKIQDMEKIGYEKQPDFDFLSELLSFDHSKIDPKNSVQAKGNKIPGHRNAVSLVHPSGSNAVQGKNITGSLRTEKIGNILTLIGNNENLLITELDTIAWLFNLRGTDITNNPTFYSYSILRKNKVILFANTDMEIAGVEIKKYEQFYSYLESINDQEFLVSGNFNAYIGGLLPNKRFTSDIRMMQSIKNEYELYGLLNANIIDGIALLRLFEWITYTTDSFSEIEISDKLDEIKKEINGSIIAYQVNNPDNDTTSTGIKNFDTIVGIGASSVDMHPSSGTTMKSFDTIVGIGANSSDMHHANTTKKLEKADMVLIDSGSQYLFGTTDITRTLNREPTPEMKEKYTIVLKSVIAAKLFRHSKSSNPMTGEEIDSAARTVANMNGFDYDSATGHGIGAGLSVHEHPPVIGNGGEKLHPGQVFSIEPGYYKEGQFGVRIEDDVFLDKFNNIRNLTFVPVHMNLIDKARLSSTEKWYLNEYNKKIRRLFESLTKDRPGHRYLIENTQEID